MATRLAPASAFRIRKLTPRIGAELLDIDVTRLTDRDVREIRAALLENLVVFFRDQTMTPEQHKAFAASFGELVVDRKARSLPTVEGHPEVAIILADKDSKSANGEVWHSDGAADPVPSMGAILYLKEMPENEGGDTIFANTHLAYDRLSPAMQAFLEPLTAVNDFTHAVRQRYPQFVQDNAPLSEHPVIRVHPESGRKSLFVNRLFTSHIVQIDRPQSDALLRSLFDHIEQPIFQCRFKWRANSIAFWDNRAVQHYAVWDYFPHRRIGHRITIAGTKPIGVTDRTQIAGASR